MKFKNKNTNEIKEFDSIMINSNLLSAQNRKRFYWTNIPDITIPEDKGILLKDIVHEYCDDVDITDYIVPFDKTLQILDKEVEKGKVGYFRKDSQANRVYYIHDKAVTLCGEAGGGSAKMGMYLFADISKRVENVSVNKSEIGTVKNIQGEGKSNTLIASQPHYIHKNIEKCFQPLDEDVIQGELKKNYLQYDISGKGHGSQDQRAYYLDNKHGTLPACGGASKCKVLFGCITPDRVDKRQQGQRFNKGDKFYTLTAQDKHGVLVDGYIRKLTPIECERLQTLDDNYTKCEGVSNSQRYRCLGNGWTVDVIAHILKGIK